MGEVAKLLDINSRWYTLLLLHNEQFHSLSCPRFELFTFQKKSSLSVMCSFPFNRIILFHGKVTLKMDEAQERSQNHLCFSTKLYGVQSEDNQSSVMLLIFCCRVIPYESLSLRFLAGPIEKLRLVIPVAVRRILVIAARAVMYVCEICRRLRRP